MQTERTGQVRDINGLEGDSKDTGNATNDELQATQDTTLEVVTDRERLEGEQPVRDTASTDLTDSRGDMSEIGSIRAAVEVLEAQNAQQLRMIETLAHQLGTTEQKLHTAQAENRALKTEREDINNAIAIYQEFMSEQMRTEEGKLLKEMDKAEQNHQWPLSTVCASGFTSYCQLTDGPTRQ